MQHSLVVPAGFLVIGLMLAGLSQMSDKTSVGSSQDVVIQQDKGVALSVLCCENTSRVEPQLTSVSERNDEWML